MKSNVIDDTYIYIYVLFFSFFCAAHQQCNIYVHMYINMCVCVFFFSGCGGGCFVIDFFFVFCVYQKCYGYD